jgi:DNA-directed RNA polymerase subunit beta
MVPGASAKERRHLGPDGLPRIGALVRGHDILVGKVTPRPGLADAAPELTPHQSFVCAIIGQTARPPRDTSLRLPHGAI